MILKIWILAIESKNNCIKYLQLKLLKQKPFNQFLTNLYLKGFILHLSLYKLKSLTHNNQ